MWYKKLPDGLKCKEPLQMVLTEPSLFHSSPSSFIFILFSFRVLLLGLVFGV